MILVVGATGQLGSTIVKKLLDRGDPVRALCRRTSNSALLNQEGVEIAFGDLLDPATLDAACRGVDTIVSTANAAVPTRTADSFKMVDGRGYEHLIDKAKRNNVRHFIFTSVLSQPGFDDLPLVRQKRATEEHLQKSGLKYTIFRADIFMDVAFAMMGSDLPIRGSEAATVARPFWFTSKFFSGIKDGMIKDGVAGVMGDGETRHTYISIDDLAEFHVRAVNNSDAENKIFDIGGPEALSQKDVVAIFEKVLGRPLKPKHTPVFVFKIGYHLLRFISPPAANIMGLNYFSATTSSTVDMNETARLFDVKLTSAEEFLQRKALIGD